LGFLNDRINRAWPAYNQWLRWVLDLAAIVYVLYLFAIMIRIAREPVNYRSLKLSDSGLEYEPIWKERLIIPWQEIESVVFCREPAVFEDYLETKWLIKTNRNERAGEIMDEWGNRSAMVRALRKFLSEFDRREASKGLRSRKEGKWVCFQRPPYSTGEMREEKR
jgi:hypothetical protein